MYCLKCGKELKDGDAFCASCGASTTSDSVSDTGNLVRFLLTFFLGFIGSIVINHTTLKPTGWTSRSWAYFLLEIITFGIYGLVASICNLIFDPNKNENIGYFRD